MRLSSYLLYFIEDPGSIENYFRSLRNLRLRYLLLLRFQNKSSNLAYGSNWMWKTVSKIPFSLTKINFFTIKSI